LRYDVGLSGAGRVCASVHLGELTTHHGSNLPKAGDPPRRPISSLRQTATLVIVEAEASVAELGAEDSMLLAEILQDFLLFFVEPASEGGEEEEMRHEGVLHGLRR